MLTMFPMAIFAEGTVLKAGDTAYIIGNYDLPVTKKNERERPPNYALSGSESYVTTTYTAEVWRKAERSVT